jgi:hypothetical protein
MQVAIGVGQPVKVSDGITLMAKTDIPRIARLHRATDIQTPFDYLSIEIQRVGRNKRNRRIKV